MTIRRLTRCLTLTAVLLAALWLAGLIFYVGAMDDQCVRGWDVEA